MVEESCAGALHTWHHHLLNNVTREPSLTLKSETNEKTNEQTVATPHRRVFVWLSPVSKVRLTYTIVFHYPRLRTSDTLRYARGSPQISLDVSVSVRFYAGLRSELCHASSAVHEMGETEILFLVTRYRESTQSQAAQCRKKQSLTSY